MVDVFITIGKSEGTGNKGSERVVMVTLRNQRSCIYKRLDHAILKYSKQLGTKSCSREVFDGLDAFFV